MYSALLKDGSLNSDILNILQNLFVLFARTCLVFCNKRLITNNMISPSKYINPFAFEFMIDIIIIKNAIKNGDINDIIDRTSTRLKFMPLDI
jgi:hypothetical protein